MNNFRKNSLMCILVFTLLLFFSLQATFAANVTIGPTTAINSVISNVNNNETLFLNPGTYNKTGDINITINRSITIQANGSAGSVIIDARGASKIFTISPNLNVTFINITFTRGNQTNLTNGSINQGGAIYSDGSTINFIRCTFANNTATNYGGAICAIRSRVNVIDSNFVNNTVTFFSQNIILYGGGAIYTDHSNLTVIGTTFTSDRVNYMGGAIYSTNSFVNVSDCNFINNSAVRPDSNNGLGGAILIYQNSTFILDSSNFINNSANNYGGAIYVREGSTANISNSNFTNNHATNHGGAIYGFNPNINVINSNFINNSAVNGGAIRSEGANFNISNSYFLNNSGGVGGVIHNTAGNINVNNSIFINNSANNNGGVIYNTGNVNLFNNTMDDNRVINGNGGAIYTSGSLNVYNSRLVNNNGTYGGAIYNNYSNVVVSGSNFTNNIGVHGGVIHNYGNVTIANSNFVNNTASRGGVIYNFANFTINGSNFTNNVAIVNGGVIINHNGSFSVFDSNFINNTALGIGESNGASVIFNFNEGNFNVSYSNFINNTSPNSAGAILNFGNFRLISSNFTDNTATIGAGICNEGNFTVDYSNFINNTAFEDGGAILNSNGALTITNSVFINNYANDDGAGIYAVTSAYLGVFNSTFTNNLADIGGGIFAHGNNILISGSTFTNNSQAIALLTTNFTLNNNIISSNGIAVQFILNNMNFTISALSANNTITDNLFAVGISGNNSNYTISDSFGSLNNGGFIFTGTNNAIVNSAITGYNRADSWAVFFDGLSMNNSIISSNLTGNIRAIGINGTNNRVIGSNIFNNDLGIHVLSGSSNAVINFNRIFNNTNSLGFDLINTGINTNADYNWWGTNTPLVNGVNLNNWFVMELSANSQKTLANATIYEPNGNVELTYQLSLLDNNTGVTSFYNTDLLPYFFVNLIWNGSNGTFYNLSNVDARRRYSQNVTLTLNDFFTLQAIADNSNINLSLRSDLSHTINLSITKTSNVTGNANFGDYVEYNITVTNYGPANATNLIVTDILDSRLIFVNATGNYNYSSGYWIIGNLNSGDSITLTIIVRINGTGNIVNLANLTVDELNLGNNSTDGNGTNFTVPSTVNLTITKTTNATEFMNLGDFVEYTIIVTNHGPDNATGIVVSDVLDSRLVFVNATGNHSFNGTHVIWNVGDLNVDSNVTLTLIVRINGTGNITNIANVSMNETNIGNNGTDGNDSNFTVNATVNLAITKFNNLTLGVVVGVGDLVTYTIVVSNFGPDNATGVVVTDVLDNRLVFVNTTGNYNVTTGLWTIGNLNVGNTVSLNITVRVNGTGNIANVANVSVNETNIGNNSTGGNDTNFTVNATVNLTITKTNNLTPGAVVNVGDLITYIITVSNSGPDNATGVVVTDVLDSRLIFVNSSGNYDNGTGLWTIGNLNVGDTVSLSIFVRVNGTGNIANVANVSVNETNIGNNSTGGNDTNFTVNATVNLTITKSNNLTPGAVVNVGDLITYIITVSNSGPDNATGVVVTDVLD
ncbi:MAG: hypothetical protein FWH29_05100, partial [Methanobrevibacter sp.]|nr:hypothetical protein [Methanobrevibacter sp.]